jgi:hypothetical protein
MYRYFVGLFIILLVNSSFGLQTTSESANPFSKFSGSTTGVSEYTGIGSASIPLTSISGVNVALNYSSNVTINARSANSVAPAGWCGLGWNLDFGSIVCDHKNTKVANDDEYYYLSGNGIADKIKKPHRLKYSYYRNYLYAAPDEPVIPPTEAGVCDNFNLSNRDECEHFLYIFEGQITLPHAGQYTFYTKINPAINVNTKVYINGALIVEGGSNAAPGYGITICPNGECSGQTSNLSAGTYPIKVFYRQYLRRYPNNCPNDYYFDVMYSHANISKQYIPETVLAHPDAAVDGNKKYYIESNPLLKFDPQDLNNDGVLEGWIVTYPDGTKYKYGDLNYSGAARNSTRYTFNNGEYVGNVTSGTSTLFPYQWDLSSIKKLTGDDLRFYYQQDKEYIKSGTFQSPVLYTKASYPFEIVNSIGEKIRFILESIPSDEEYDPQTYHAEPDAFMEMYRSKRLHSVYYFLPQKVNPRKTYILKYGQLNKDFSNKYHKSMLVEIDEYEGPPIAAVQPMATLLSYYDDETKADAYLPDYNYGALATITDMKGNVTKFSYKLQKETNTGKFIRTFTSADLSHVNKCGVGPNNDGVTSGNGMLLYGGIYDENKEFVVVKAKGGTSTAATGQTISMYTFDGHEWLLNDKIRCLDYNIEKTDVYTFKNGFVVVPRCCNGQKNARTLDVFYWSNGKWLRDYIIDDSGYEITEVHMGNDFLVIRCGTGGDANEYISVYRCVNERWIVDNNYKRHSFGRVKAKIISVGTDFFVVKEVGRINNSWLVQWDGKQWTHHTIQHTGHEVFENVFTGSNYVVFVGGSGEETYRDFIWVYYWTGTEWKYSENFGGANGAQMGSSSSDKTIIPSNGYFVVRKYKDGDPEQNCSWEIWIVTWNGNDWQIKQVNPVPNPGSCTGNCKVIDIVAGPSYVLMRGGDAAYYDVIGIYNRTNNDWIQDADYAWSTILWPSGRGYNYQIIPGNNSFAISTLGEGPDKYADIFHRIYTYDGSRWKIATTLKNRTRWNRARSNGNIISQTAGHSFYGFVTLQYNDNVNNINNGLTYSLVHKFQDNFDVVNSYVVGQKTVSVANLELPQLITYNYFDSYFDAYAGILKFNKVETVSPKLGKTVNYFFNDSRADNQQNQNINYKDLDGLAYRSETYNKESISTNQTKLATNATQYEVFKREFWPEETFLKRVTKTEQNTLGKKIVGEMTYNNFNNLQKTSTINNSDGKIKTTEIKYAFEDINYKDVFGINGAYILNQPCQTTIYGKESVNGSRYVLSSSAVTYRNVPHLQAWLPYETYSLNIALKNDGFPDRNYVFNDFNHATDATNVDWKFAGRIERYSQLGSLQETLNAAKIHSVEIKRAGEYQHIATINAKFEECGVFTGDYDLNDEGSFFDKANGWRMGAFNEESPTPLPGAESIVCEDAKHFGNKGIKVTNAFGPSRVFKLEKDKDYVLSAWVKKQSGNVPLQAGMIMGIDYRKRKSAEGTWPIDVFTATESSALPCYGIVTAKPFGGWYYVEMNVPVKDDIADEKWNEGYQYASVWVGVPHGTGSGQSATVYIDDIRFYPKKSIVTSTYYDENLGLPIISIDANNNPGNRMSYDNYARPWKTYKVNKDSNIPDVLLAEKEYYLKNMIENGKEIKLVSQSKREYYFYGDKINIKWINKTNGDVQISYVLNTTETTILTNSFNAGYNSYDWEIPANLFGRIKFKVTKNSQSDIAEEDIDIIPLVYSNNFAHNDLGFLPMLSPSLEPYSSRVNIVNNQLNVTYVGTGDGLFTVASDFRPVADINQRPKIAKITFNYTSAHSLDATFIAVNGTDSLVLGTTHLPEAVNGDFAQLLFDYKTFNLTINKFILKFSIDPTIALTNETFKIDNFKIYGPMLPPEPALHIREIIRTDYNPDGSDPRGPTDFQEHDRMTIDWYTRGNISQVSISWGNVGNDPHRPIVTNITNSGSYIWPDVVASDRSSSIIKVEGLDSTGAVKSCLSAPYFAAPSP